jgi:hypothetical protein
MKNIHTSQLEHTAIDWNNSKSVCNRRTLIDRIVTSLNVRANEARYESESDYQRIMAQTRKISQASDSELAQYAIDLGITIVRIN